MILIPPQGLIDHLVAGLQRALLRLLIKPVFSPRFSIAFQRRWLEWMARSTPVPRGIEIVPDSVGGVPGEWVRHARVPKDARGTLVYLHGGAYCIGSPATHRALTARLSRGLGLPVFVPNYRMAPEHPFPAARDDALAVCRALAERGPFLIGGDSAGGGLSLSTALALRDAGQMMPLGLLLISPWADIHVPDNPPPPPPGEAMLSAAWAKACGDFYRGSQPESDPGLSPLRADLRGLPPTLIQAGTDELLHGQALELETALQVAGVPVRCEVAPGRWHVYQLQAGLMRSADEAIARMCAFGRSLLPRTQVAGVPFVEVAILGAGMSGLCMALQLQKAGQHDFLMLEKQPGLGGTWWDNTYPGAHVDVPAPVYSFSFAPNPGWRERFASAPEIQAYMQALADRHGLHAHLRLGTQLQSAHFDEVAGLWTLHSTDGQMLKARFFVCSTGPLSQPRWPDIPGIDSFAGARLHSARWDHACPLDGKRIAVIGTGSTASQLVAPVAARAGQLHVFQRTANWVMPRLERRYTAWDRRLAHFPPYARLVRAAWVLALEWGRRGFDEGTLARRGMLKTAAVHLKRQVPDAALRERLRPPYPLGCKRIIYSNDFYRALTRPNVELVTDAIACITPQGIVTADGRERAMDVLICATGFDTENLLSSVEVSGLQGRTLAQTWQDGPHAYHGLTVSGFPNLFLMLGPNTATGHTSTLLFIEPGVQHAIACMQAVRAGRHRWIDLKPGVLAQHNEMLQSRLAGSVWSQCRSWYRMNGDGRIVALWPGFTREYVQAVRRVDFGAYRFG